MISRPNDPPGPPVEGKRRDPPAGGPTEPGAELLHLAALARKLIDVERRALVATMRRAAVSIALVAAGALTAVVLLAGAALAFLRGLTGAVTHVSGAPAWVAQLTVGAALPLGAALVVGLLWARADRRRAARSTGEGGA